MAPHGIYPAHRPDTWVAIACRHDADWRSIAAVIAEPWTSGARFDALAGRLEHEDELDARLGAWTRERDPAASAALLQDAGVPASAVQSPEQRIDGDPNTRDWGLWPEVEHTEMGRVRVDGVPAHFSETDWLLERAAPCLGEHNDTVFRELLGLSAEEIADLRAAGVI